MPFINVKIVEGRTSDRKTFGGGYHTVEGRYLQRHPRIDYGHH